MTESKVNLGVDFSFIICTYNGAARLPETLGHLLAQRVSPRYDWELLVVNNASTDGTAEVVRQWEERFCSRLRLIDEATQGKTHAIKTGLCAAKGRYFTLVDDDNHLCPEWVDVAVRFMDDNPNAGLIGGKIYPKFEDGAIIPADFEERYKGYLAVRDYGDDNKSDVLPIGAGMTGRTALMKRLYCELGSYLSDRVGGALGSCEDLEKSITTSHLGWETWYVPDLQMKHWIPKGRLTEAYIDRLWIEAAIAGAWLRVLRNLGPTDSSGLAMLASQERKLLRKEQLLCFLPPCTKRLRRARFWNRYYRARIQAYADVLSREAEANRIFGFIRNAPTDLRPPTSVMG